MAGFCCLNPLLFAAPAQLHHAAFGHAAIRDTTGYGGIDDAAGAWAEAEIFVKLIELVKRGIEIKHPVFQRSLTECHGVVEGKFADGLFAVLNHGDEGAFFWGLDRPAERHRATCRSLQPQRRNFQCMSQRQRFIVTAGDERPHLRKA